MYVCMVREASYFIALNGLFTMFKTTLLLCTSQIKGESICVYIDISVGMRKVLYILID